MGSRILFPTATTVKMSLRGTMVGVAHRMSCQLCIEAPHMRIEVPSLRMAEKASAGNNKITQITRMPSGDVKRWVELKHPQLNRAGQ